MSVPHLCHLSLHPPTSRLCPQTWTHKEGRIRPDMALNPEGAVNVKWVSRAVVRFSNVWGCQRSLGTLKGPFYNTALHKSRLTSPRVCGITSLSDSALGVSWLLPRGLIFRLQPSEVIFNNVVISNNRSYSITEDRVHPECYFGVQRNRVEV